MTISYNADVSSSNTFSFTGLLIRWKGSVWKAIYQELIVWLLMYYAVFAIYRFQLSTELQIAFGELATDWNNQLKLIPLTFLLGFFVTIIVDRWKNMFLNMGWIENNALFIATFFRGNDEDTRLKRRTSIRYLVLAQILVLRNISKRVHRRFPTLDAIVQAGFMTVVEKHRIEKLPTPFNKFWVPIEWALDILLKLQQDLNVPATNFNVVIGEVKTYRENLSKLVNHDWVPIPLAYPQVVFLAVRAYFILCTVSRQFLLDPNGADQFKFGMYVPVMTIIEFIFLLGWMKIAEGLLNPFGEDDDDFECNHLIDKNIATGLAIVDEAIESTPAIEKDHFLTKDKLSLHQAFLRGTDSIDGFRDVDLTYASFTETTTIWGKIKKLLRCEEHGEFDSQGNYFQRYNSQTSKH